MPQGPVRGLESLLGEGLGEQCLGYSLGCPQGMEPWGREVRRVRAGAGWGVPRSLKTLN